MSQSVRVNPADQLVFDRPLTETSKALLEVENTSDRKMAFKVKTTAPKQYCVRPNAGIIEAGSSVEVQVILQPFKEEPIADYKCKDKFLVQTAEVKHEHEGQQVTELWARLEAEDKESIKQHKIKCVYSRPKDAGAVAGESDPSPPDMDGSHHSVESAVTIQKAEEAPAEVLAKGDRPDPVTTSVPTTSAALGTAEKDMSLRNSQSEELEMKRREIKELEEQLNRQKMAAAVAQPVGYPPQVVFTVAIIVFIITYILF